MRVAARALVVASALLAPFGQGRAAEDEDRRAWFAPDHAKLQLAGAIGFLSPGVGYALLGRRVELDLFLGYAPESLAGVDLWSVTGKASWLPWRVGLGRGWTARPLYAAVQLTYTFGDRFFVFLPDRYGPEYYPLPTALRAGLALGAALGRPVGRLEHLGAYAEVVAVDLPLAYLVSNLGTVRASEVLSVALGVRVEL
ncbi:hypothetical protein [Anaeromyxobacter sp. Fw109-5]|uniref:hypothetical protein n=1 Tax=Anaeromyxobacter sp. (strain Fw109-5) TaxID=404589 RepID=UPI0000ED72F6|nr:hypothetical protein [Anaeromyxobacter sp. Fw109-5]ABS26564.1 conserved hypothetical protein [Anaeromyxobacter sp. Fw109-5]